MWDARDEVSRLREIQAKVIASKISGVLFEDVVALPEDYELADQISEMIDAKDVLMREFK